MVELKRVIEKNNFAENLIDLELKKQLTKLDILKKLSSGTELRNSIDDIVKGKMGAIIVIANQKVYDVFQGGFKVNCKFTGKRLVELAKMDGAIILSEDFKKIIYANTLLIPDRNLSSFEIAVCTVLDSCKTFLPLSHL